MAVLFNKRVFDAFVQEGETLYSDIWTWDDLGSAERLLLEARASDQSSGTNTLKVILEHSNDGVSWDDKLTIIDDSIDGSGARKTVFGEDPGSKVTGRYARLEVTLPTANTSAHIEIWATGHSNL